MMAPIWSKISFIVQAWWLIFSMGSYKPNLYNTIIVIHLKCMMRQYTLGHSPENFFDFRPA